MFIRTAPGTCPSHLHRRRGLFCVYTDGMWKIEVEGTDVAASQDEAEAIAIAKEKADMHGMSVLYGPYGRSPDVTVRVEVRPLAGGGYEIVEKPASLS